MLVTFVAHDANSFYSLNSEDAYILVLYVTYDKLHDWQLYVTYRTSMSYVIYVLYVKHDILVIYYTS